MKFDWHKFQLISLILDMYVFYDTTSFVLKTHELYFFPPQQMAGELEQQKALLQQVLSLTPEQINSLPPEQRQQVLQLQQALRT